MKTHSTAQGKAGGSGADGNPVAGAPSPAANLTETIKVLLLLAHEQGHVTFDDSGVSQVVRV